jgi:flagellar basal-body rod protein FlgF
MSDIFGITAVGMLDGQKRLDATSQNAAHATTTGYRRQVAASRPFGHAFEASSAAAVEVAGAPSPIRAERGVDLRAGQLIATRRPLDVAIEGSDAFFALSDGRRVWLTRAGSFRIDAEGYLVGEGGLRLQGAQGDVRLDHGDVEIRADGRIVREGAVLATLRLFKPAAGSSIAPVRGSLLGLTGGVDAVEDVAALRAGFLESSNATANSEMLGLVALTRQFESLVRVTQGYDDALAKTIQRLGEI